MGLARRARGQKPPWDRAAAMSTHAALRIAGTDRETRMTTIGNTTTTTAPTSTIVGQTWGDVTAVAPSLAAAVWCSTVGTTWTLELHHLARGSTRGTLDWISSGIPTSQPVPDGVARQLLADRGLHLFFDSTVPNVRRRRSIGYVCADAGLITLADRIRAEAAEAGVHPVLLAAQRIATGSHADAGRRGERPTDPQALASRPEKHHPS